MTLIRVLALIMIVASPAWGASRLFYDGFESGNSNLWSQEGSHTRCPVVGSSADGLAGTHAGSYMARCNWSSDGNSAGSGTWEALVRNGPRSEYGSEVLWRWWFRRDASLNGGTGPKLFRIATGYSFGDLTVNNNPTTGSFEAAIFDANGSSFCRYWGVDTVGDLAWHKIELYIYSHPSAGIVRMWVDSNLVKECTGMNTAVPGTATDFYGYNVSWTSYIFPSNWSASDGCCAHDATNYAYWDDFEIFSDSTGGTAATGSMSDATVTVGGGGGDTTPPVISSPLPTGTQPYGTTSVTLQVTTNENATCRYSATDVAYASMASTFGSTGGTTHQQTGFAVSNGQNYTRYVRCIDSFGNANTSSTAISFSVSAVNETILDNDGAGSSQSGSWLQSTYVAGYYGANYHYAPEAVGHWFQWTTSISPGTYVVYARWPAIVGRPTNAQYEITNSSGTATVGANQTENGNQWNMLGTYTFGSTATVRLLSSASGPEGAAADAVRFLAAAGDVTAPSTTISTSDPSTIYSDSLSVTGTASDAVGVIGCKWRIGSAPNASNGTACTGTTSFSCSTSGYSIGSNALHVGCYDAAGNYGTDSITVSYPCKKLATPSGLSFVGLVANPPSNATLSFDWSDVTTHADGSALTGDLANYRTYWGTVSGGPYNTSSSASSQISVGPTNANVTYYARVAAESSVNSICNSDQTAEISLFADTVPPVLSGLNPSGNYPKTAANVALGVTTNEAATCRHGSAGSAWSSKTAFSTTGATSHSATLAVWAGLVKRICYQCRDAMLNESAESCTTFSVSAKQKAGGFN